MERKQTMRANLTSHPVENGSSKTTSCPSAQPLPIHNSAQKLLLTMMKLTMMTQIIKCKETRAITRSVMTQIIKCRETRAITRTVMCNCKDRSRNIKEHDL